jgi:hypothetical protein
LPFEVLIAADGSFTVTYGGTVSSTINGASVVYESSGTCSGNVSESGYVECTGTVNSTATVAGTAVSSSNP